MLLTCFVGFQIFQKRDGAKLNLIYTSLSLLSVELVQLLNEAREDYEGGASGDEGGASSSMPWKQLMSEKINQNIL